MPLAAKNMGTRGSKEQPELTTHMARLVGLVDLGHQPGYEYQGKKIESSWQIEFTYELPRALMEDGRPHFVSEQVKVDDYEGKSIVSKMMSRVRTLDPENISNDGKDLAALLGKPCMVTLSPGNNGYVKLKGQAAVGGVPLGVEVPPLVNPTFVFDMEDPDMDLFYSFPQFKQERIVAAINYEETELCRQLLASDM